MLICGRVRQPGMGAAGLCKGEALRRGIPGPRPRDQAARQTEGADTESSVERLMGTKAETRFALIQEKAEFAGEELLDV